MSEHEEQVTVTHWAKYNEGRWPCLAWLFAIPNGAKLPYGHTKGGRRYSPQAQKLLAEGMRPGVSDLFLPVPNRRFCGLFIELKVGTNKPTQLQLDFMYYANSVGYLATACWGAEQAIWTLECYLADM